ncbi:MAG: 16S rRNA processing protein RimM [Clostridia bacterium]|nr:16S rRNA processing protein RimM [Clostridia bacterium]
MKKEYLEGGKICTSHGVRGALKVEHLCDSASVLASQKRVFFKLRDGSYEERRVVSASVSGKFVLMMLSGIDSRESAIAERGRLIYLHRSDIPVESGAMLLSDMIGLPVIHAETGERLGELSDISDVAGRCIYTVRCASGDVLIPAVDEFIKEINEEEGVKILPIPGFFDAADEI